MRRNPLRAKLERDEAVFGPMVMEVASPELPQILPAAGADCVIYE